LEPQVVGPHSPDRARPISALAAEVRDASNGFVDEISSALIGSCTNSSYEDMSRSADVAEQASAHGIKSAVPFMVTPGSEQVRATIERDGQMGSLKGINGTVLANACGPCIGQWRRSSDVSSVPNTIVTSYNRNFPQRNDGQPSTMNFIASPEIVTALAVAGKLSFNPLTDTITGADGQPFKLEPPKPAPEVPERDFDKGNSSFFAPPEDGSDIVLSVSPDSERIELMEPWPAWDGNDFIDMPVLMKTKGKTTTDHISPAGPWLRFRGHLSKFSENMFMGAINAYTDEAGKGKNVFSGETGRAISRIALDYRARGVKWVVVGDSNYGEGSSREHAALSPRLLGSAAIISRSFARIHETNLKKQGLLPLTFSDPADYDRIREDDRISLVELNDLAAGKPVKCIVQHSDGSSETLSLNHTISESQIEWFRIGGALNMFHK
ncbi:MAG: aconitate hydratase, partial [Chloroflexi bacterium]|nr:aconitate hydratase [Chloroflexota bacterium]